METPLNIGRGLYFYHVSQSKKLINFLADLNLSVNYQKIVNVKKGIVEAVLQKKRGKLHAIDVCKRDPFTKLTISCSDTDVLLILLNYFDQLPSTTAFKTTHHQYNLHSIYEKFTRVCTALLGFHAMTGSDQTGKFNGFTKKMCWDTFIQSTDQVISLLHSCLIQRIMDGNGITNIRCMMLL